MARCREMRGHKTEDGFIWLHGGDEWELTRVGKWMMFVGCSVAPGVWQTICSGGFVSAKISASEEQGDPHVICIYTHDFRDVDDVDEIGLRLVDRFSVTSPIFYKPDSLTYKHISGSVFGLRNRRFFTTPGFKTLPQADQDAVMRALEARRAR